MILKSIATANRIVHWTFVLAALVAGGAAHAQVLFQTGFEPPAYTTGALNGQNGWAAPSNGTVESSTVLTGSQAVQFSSSGLEHAESYQSTDYLLFHRNFGDVGESPIGFSSKHVGHTEQLGRRCGPGFYRLPGPGRRCQWQFRSGARQFNCGE